MNDRQTVFVVDDDQAARESLRWLLESVGYHVDCFTSALEFLESYDGSVPGCLVLDVRMPGMSGLELQNHLLERGWCLPAIIVTGHGDVPMAVRAMKAGAVDFLVKPIERALLLDAIDRAFARIDTAEGRALEEAEACRQVDLLTPRERDVLEGLAQGLPNKTIAYDLGISSRTVEVHRASIMSKLGVRTLAETLRIAFAAGMGRPL